MENVIEVKNLSKKYGSLTAVDGISFEVKKGEVFGLLGENGAGKTTTLEIIEGLRKPSSGEIDVLGHNIAKGLSQIKQKIGVQLQASAYYNFLTLKEIIELFGAFYSKSLPADDLLRQVNLQSKSKSYVQNLSGGQKQRFSIVASLVNDPEIVFLDEPTTGLDPLARRNLWEVIAQIKARGKTIILTTHYMEEAEILCDRVAIMEKGKIIALDHTHKLLESAKNPFKVTVFFENPPMNIETRLKTLGTVKQVGGKSGDYEIGVRSKEDLNKVLIAVQKLNPDSFTIGRSKLEDLFIELTGKAIKEDSEE